MADAPKARRLLERHKWVINVASAAGAIKRVELFGKPVNMQAFKDNIEHSGAIGITVEPEDTALRCS